MTTRYFVDASGVYLGGFLGAEPPAGAVEIPAPPEHGRQVYDFEAGTWGPIPVIVPERATKLGLKRAMVEAGRWEQIKAMIEANPEIAEDWSLAVEVSRTDPMFAAFVASGSFTASEIDAVFVRAVEIVA